MFSYPAAVRSDVVDDYHGTLVRDPYRWLEDPNSDDTAAFVKAQNALSLPYLQGLPERRALAERMAALWDVRRTYAPIRRSEVVVWAENDGLAEQPTYFVRVDGQDERVLLDPNELADDGTKAVYVTSLSPDGRLFAYTVSESGSDWQIVKLRDTETGSDLDDVLHHVKFTGIAWHGEGFFYSRFPETPHDSVGVNTDMTVCYHRLGTAQEQDEVVFHDEQDPEPMYWAEVSHDGRFLVLTEHHGTSRKNGLLYLDLEDTEAGWTRLIDAEVALSTFLVHQDGNFLIHTDLDAPNGRVVEIRLGDPEEQNEIVPEPESAIESVAAYAGELLVIKLDDASHALDRHDLTGARLGTVALPGLGTIAAINGQFDAAEVYLEYQSFTEPPSAWVLANGTVERFAAHDAPLPDDYVVTRDHATSTDGAAIGMFVLRHRDTTFPAPVDLYGYGGFTINMTPVFNPARLAFLDAGGVVVVTNLRGGKEHGEEWHRQGMLGNKQQVFDDFISCAEHLIASGATTRRQLSISGRSNGGLLTTAAMLQRPDLFGAVISHVPVTDMLRFQHFTAGRYWTSDYGDSADAEAFRYQMAYSPLHNVDEDVDYPPTLITTGESDDRVVPMHSLKMAATLQHATGGSSERPLLLRVDTRAGHGLGKPTSKLIDEWADSYAFVLAHCGT